VPSGVSGVARHSPLWHIIDEVATPNIFYIDQDPYLRKQVSSNSSKFQANIWQDGPLNSLNLKVDDADMIGLLVGFETWDSGTSKWILLRHR
jgi:hypothetical protein